MTAVGVFHLARPIPLIIAQVRGMRGAHVDVSSMLLWLGIAAVVVGGVVAGAILMHRAAVKRQKNSHPGLFDALCKVHNFQRSQRSLLLQVVRVRNMPFPAQIFTEPKWTSPKSLPAALKNNAAELAKLHKALFS